MELLETPGEGRAGNQGAVGLVRRQGDDDLALAVFVQIIAGDMTLALGRPAFAHRQQPRQPAIGGPAHGKTQHAEATGEVELRADHQPQPKPPRRAMGPYHPGQSIAVGDGDGAVAERGGGGNQLIRMGRTAQKAEIRRHLKLGVGRGAGHANTPCRYHFA